MHEWIIIKRVTDEFSCIISPSWFRTVWTAGERRRAEDAGKVKSFFQRGSEGGGKRKGRNKKREQVQNRKGWFNGERKRAVKAEEGRNSR